MSGTMVTGENRILGGHLDHVSFCALQSTQVIKDRLRLSAPDPAAMVCSVDLYKCGSFIIAAEGVKLSYE